MIHDYLLHIYVPFFVQYFVKLFEVTLSLNFFQNLPRDALPDGSPVREKLANYKRPKKFKTSENDFSHGSFFLRIGGISKFWEHNLELLEWNSVSPFLLLLLSVGEKNVITFLK